MIKNILLTTDFSIASERAIRCAIKLFEKVECNFTLFHSSEEVDSSKTEFYLKKFCEDLEWNCIPHHSFSPLYINQSAEFSIKLLNQKHKFDIAVVGTTGVGNNQYFGSFAQLVYNHIQAACLFIPHHSTVKEAQNAQIIIEASECFNIQKLVNLRNHLEALTIKPSILLVTKDVEEEQKVRKSTFKDIKHLFGGLNSNIEICNNYVDGICNKLWSCESDIVIFFLKKDLQNLFYSRAAKQLISDFHPAPIMNVPSLQWAENPTMGRASNVNSFSNSVD